MITYGQIFPLGDRGPLARAARRATPDRSRWPSSPSAASAPSPPGTTGERRLAARPRHRRGGRRARRRPRGPAGAAPVGHLPGAGHRRLRAWPSTGGSSTCPTSTSARSTSASSSSARPTVPPMKLFGYEFDTPGVPAHARRRCCSRSSPLLVGGAPLQRLRPPARRHARQRGGLRHLRPQPAVAPPRRVHAVGRHRRARRGALRHAARRGLARAVQPGDRAPALRARGRRRRRAGRRRARSPGSASTACSRSPPRSARSIAKINTVTPGLTGIGLGRNPSGVVPLMSERRRAGAQRPARARRDGRGDGRRLRAPPARRVRQLAVRDPAVRRAWWRATTSRSTACRPAPWPTGARPRRRPIDLEWVGITSPWTPDRLGRGRRRRSTSTALRPPTLDGAPGRPPSARA